MADDMSSSIESIQAEATAVASEARGLAREASGAAFAAPEAPLTMQLQSLERYLDIDAQRYQMLLDQAETMARHKVLIEQTLGQIKQLAASIRTAIAKLQVPPAEPARQE